MRGAARFYRDSVFVRASYGTGAGIVLGGQVHVGFAGTAGEIGHVQVDPDGELCRCGSRGCLDTVVGAAALTGPLRETHGTLTLRDVVQGAIDGDPGCARVIAEAGSTIGVVVAGLVIALNPQAVVVGGELAETGEILVGTAAGSDPATGPAQPDRSARGRGRRAGGAGRGDRCSGERVPLDRLRRSFG